MAYMSQENKKALAPKIMEICKQYGIKATLSVDNYSTLNLNIKSGKLDFLGPYNALREEYCSRENERVGFKCYQYHEATNGDIYPGHIICSTEETSKTWEGDTFKFLQEVSRALNIGNHNNSDLMTDYHDVGWYTNIRVGRYDKPYILEK